MPAGLIIGCAAACVLDALQQLLDPSTFGAGGQDKQEERKISGVFSKINLVPTISGLAP